MDALPLPLDLIEYISHHMRATQLQAAIRGYRVRARLLQLCEGRADWICDDDVCDYQSAFPNEPCACTHTKTVKYNTTVQLVLTNLGIGAFGMHPMHLHGHSFRVLYVGYPPVYNDTRTVCKWPAGAPHPECLSSDDIVCANGTGCAVASWRGGAPPAGALNFDRPVVKDTLVVPPGGYAVVRFVADNPGLWHLHCHMAHHLQSGMGMLLNEAPEKQPLFPPPPGFPRCGSLPDSSVLKSHVADSRGRWEALHGAGLAAEEDDEANSRGRGQMRDER